MVPKSPQSLNQSTCKTLTHLILATSPLTSQHCSDPLHCGLFSISFSVKHKGVCSKSYKSCKLRSGVFVDQTCFSSISKQWGIWRIINTLRALSHVLQTIPEQHLQCSLADYPAARHPFHKTVALTWEAFMVCKNRYQGNIQKSPSRILHWALFLKYTLLSLLSCTPVLWAFNSGKRSVWTLD